MSRAADVIIVGAGIVGAACARALAREEVDVLILDRRSVGSGATAASMGHILVMDDSEAELLISQLSQQLWEELYPQMPRECEISHCGTLWIATDEEEMAEAVRKQKTYQNHNVEARVVTGKEIAKLEPNLRDGLVGGLVVPGDSVIYPPPAARWLLEEAKKLGARATIGVNVTAITGTSVTLEDGTILKANHVLNATGTWAPELTPGLPIRPRKGHLIITDRYPDFVTYDVLELGYLKSAHSAEPCSVAMVLQPRPTGQLLIGSSRQLDKCDREIEPEILRRIMERTLHFAPGLANVSVIRTWTGLRAVTPDSLPIIGPHPEIPNLHVATGHEGHGITTSLGTAEIVVSHLTGKVCPIPVEPYLSHRFQKAMVSPERSDVL